MDNIVRIWYVSAQRLCNFHCDYCVSIGDYAKSNAFDWLHPNDHADFEQVVQWIGRRPFMVGIRLGTLGEPFASRDFLAQVAWLTNQRNIAFVELLTNGSLLKRRLPLLESKANLSKLSLWITHHHTEISVERFIENARFAQEQYGCFTVVNGLLFPDNLDEVSRLRHAATEAGLRFNMDLGYDPGSETAEHYQSSAMVPILRTAGGIEKVLEYGADPRLLDANLLAMDRVHQQPCAAGHNYFYIGIDGDVYPCSRYYVLKKNRLGNVADPGFELNRRELRFAPCQAHSGCCNKEDFLNLEVASGDRSDIVPSLGWIGT